VGILARSLGSSSDIFRIIGNDFIVPSVLRKNLRIEADWQPLSYANARKKRNAFNVNAHKSLPHVHVNATVCPEHDLHHSLRRWWVMKERSGDCSQWSRRDGSRLPLFAKPETRARARTHTCVHVHV